jgi:hypothetical protein
MIPPHRMIVLMQRDDTCHSPTAIAGPMSGLGRNSIGRSWSGI